jgi:hypothetical protein
MQDAFTGLPTCLRGAKLPSEAERVALLGSHWARLRAFDHLVKIAGECGIKADQDRHFFVLPEDEVSLLESAGAPWSDLGEAIRCFRRLLPFVPLAVFGFEAHGEDIFETNTPQLVRIGGGVEALAFEAADTSIYKFFFFREGGYIGSGFAYERTEEGLIRATAFPGDYRLLLEKLLLVDQIGVPTEVVGISPEGVVIVKQMLGEALPQGLDTSRILPAGLIVIPSRFLRADRDHPRLYFLADRPWLIADLHARNMVRCTDGQLRVIDLVAGPWPLDLSCGDPLITDWLERVRHDPQASALPGARDDEL